MDDRGSGMSIKYLITPSLLGSFTWYLSDESEDGREKFLQTLGRIKTPSTPTQQKGLDFESAICRVAEHLAKWKCESDCVPALEFANYQVVKEIAEQVCYGLWQQSVKKEIKIGNLEFLLYGRTDVIKRDIIYDIKFTSNYELGKFQDSSQHLIYLYCSELPKFSYLISDGKDWWKEDYVNDGNVENRIKSMISDFLGYLENDKEAGELYFNNWVSK